MTNWRPGDPLVLETENYSLRSLSPVDATPEYISWWNDAEIQGGRGLGPRKWGRQEAERHIRQFNNRQSFHLGIFPHDENGSIGTITFDLKGHKLAKTGIVIGNKHYWGKKVPLEVRARVFDFLFMEMGMEKIAGAVMARNFSAVFNYKAQGFTCEGVLRKQLIGPDGEREDYLIFGLLRDEWMDQKKLGGNAMNGKNPDNPDFSIHGNVDQSNRP